MKYLIIIAGIFFTTAAFSQDFSTDIANAKTAYSAGKLEDAHFFYKFGRYDEAKAKAEWVLRLDPTCSRAKRILEACAPSKFSLQNNL